MNCDQCLTYRAPRGRSRVGCAGDREQKFRLLQPTGRLAWLTFICVFSTILSTLPLRAGDGWTVRRIEAATVPAEIVKEQRALSSGGLPDGLVATFGGDGDLRAAWYGAPTRRYGHAVLGDGVEAGALVVRTKSGRLRSLVLDKTQVFEDRYPRLADLDGDGRIEVITIRSSLTEGASVAVYGLVGGALRQLAATPFIGRANRWLNIAGVADFAGMGGKQIAFVETPHIGGTLYLVALKDGRLVRIARLGGFSNHVIGAREMRLSAITDINGDGRPDLVLPSADRRALRMIGLVGGKFVELARVALPGRIDRAIRIDVRGGERIITVGLGDGRVFAISRLSLH